VANAWNVSGDFHAVSETDPGDFTQRGIRLLRRGCFNLCAHPPPLRAGLERRRLGFVSHS
jgi:hypothetical protein